MCNTAVFNRYHVVIIQNLGIPRSIDEVVDSLKHKKVNHTIINVTKTQSDDKITILAAVELEHQGFLAYQRYVIGQKVVGLTFGFHKVDEYEHSYQEVLNEAKKARDYLQEHGISAMILFKR